MTLLEVTMMMADEYMRSIPPGGISGSDAVPYLSWEPEKGIWLPMGEKEVWDSIPRPGVISR